MPIDNPASQPGCLAFLAANPDGFPMVSRARSKHVETRSRIAGDALTGLHHRRHHQLDAAQHIVGGADVAVTEHAGHRLL